MQPYIVRHQTFRGFGIDTIIDNAVASLLLSTLQRLLETGGASKHIGRVNTSVRDRHAAQKVPDWLHNCPTGGWTRQACSGVMGWRSPAVLDDDWGCCGGGAGEAEPRLTYIFVPGNKDCHSYTENASNHVFIGYWLVFMEEGEVTALRADNHWRPSLYRFHGPGSAPSRSAWTCGPKGQGACIGDGQARSASPEPLQASPVSMRGGISTTSLRRVRDLPMQSAGPEIRSAVERSAEAQVKGA